MKHKFIIQYKCSTALKSAMEVFMKANSLLALIVTITSCVAVPIVEAQEQIRIHYNERPPYLISVSKGVVTGLTATPASLAFQKAGIPHYWQKTPSKRQIHILEANKGKDCLVGWYKNSTREMFAKYTKPIYRDKPTIGLALFSNTDIENEKALFSVLQDRNLTLLIKSGYSYGKYIDALIKSEKPTQVKVTVENKNMIRMLYRGRGDYIFMAEEEAEGLIESTEYSKGDFKFIRFSDMPPGGERYILCSMKVEDQVIEKLNRWIE